MEFGAHDSQAGFDGLGLAHLLVGLAHHGTLLVQEQGEGNGARKMPLGMFARASHIEDHALPSGCEESLCIHAMFRVRHDTKMPQGWATTQKTRPSLGALL